MPMTDTDRLATPADLRAVLLRLTEIVRDAEALPAEARLRFWEDLNMPVEDVRISADVSHMSINALYNILVAMCGPQFIELVTGQTKGIIESALAQLSNVQSKLQAPEPPSHEWWETFLDEQFAATQGTDHEGCLQVSVRLFSIGHIGEGVLKRVDGDLNLLVLTDSLNRDCYFARKDIITLDFKRS